MPQTALTPAELEEQNRQVWRGFGRFIDRIAPTLLKLGDWTFGSLIAFNLLVLASLFTIGPATNSIKVATAAFALALPLNLAGLFLLRMVQGLKSSGLEDELAHAFQEEGLVSDQIPAPTDLEATLEAIRKRRAELVLRWSSVILAVSFLLTLTGLVGTLWYMAWWIAVSFMIVVVLSLIIVILVMEASQPHETSI
jgi:hypothetical protein